MAMREERGRCRAVRMRTAFTVTLATLLVALAARRPLAAQDAGDALSARMTLGAVSVSAFPSRRAQSHIRHGADGAVRISLTRGAREEPDRAARRATVTVCGAPAVRSERTYAAVPSQRMSIGDEHLIAPPRPRMTYVSIALVHDGRRYVVEWAVRTGRRAALRALEDAFFASIRCA